MLAQQIPLPAEADYLGAVVVVVLFAGPVVALSAIRDLTEGIRSQALGARMRAWARGFGLTFLASWAIWMATMSWANPAEPLVVQMLLSGVLYLGVLLWALWNAPKIGTFAGIWAGMTVGYTLGFSLMAVATDPTGQSGVGVIMLLSGLMVVGALAALIVKGIRRGRARAR